MARKSKKVDFVNVNDLPAGSGAQVQIPVKAVCYRAGLYARLSEETEENRERAAAFLTERLPGAAMAAAVHHREEALLLGARIVEL